MAKTVPKECPAPGCQAAFIDARDPRERLANLKQHLYQDHMDAMSREELAKLVDALPSMDEVDAPPAGSGIDDAGGPGWGTGDGRTPPRF